jgi:hypothetical protein
VARYRKSQGCRAVYDGLPSTPLVPREGLTLHAKAGANGTRDIQGHPRQPCHQRAIHNGPDRSRAVNHGQRHSDLNLRRSPSSQVTILADPALGAGGRFA